MRHNSKESVGTNGCGGGPAGKTMPLVSRAKKGDMSAISSLYRLYEKRLKKAVRIRVGDKLRRRTESNDLIQSVWKDVLSNMNGFEYRGQDSFFRWLLTRIIHKIQDKGRYFTAEKRNMKKEKPLCRENSFTRGSPLPPARGPTPSHVVSVDEQLNRLMRILDRLPDSQRQAVVFRMRDEMTFEEIGRKINRSSEAARKLYSRGVKKIGDIILREKRGMRDTG